VAAEAQGAPVSAAPAPPALAAARAGDEGAFAQLVAPHRAELHAHCYRMLGSVPDAEDALQEALLRAWRGLPRFEGRSSFRSWLYTIATNVCFRAIERRPRRVLPIDYGPAADPHDALGAPLVESVWIDLYPDAALGPEARYEQRESVELAFIAALQRLPARQRAVLILRDVLGLSGAEVAEALETTPASVYSALQRAHRTMDDNMPGESQQATLRSLGDDAGRAIVEGFVDAWERSDLDALVALLAEDARLTMPPIPTWFEGRDAVATFLRARPFSGRRAWRLLPTRANGQLAVAEYVGDGATAFRPHGITVLTLAGPRIEEMTAYLMPELFDRFGLPDHIRP
jgi:RNA polymerase sigma-70 factor (ECF subfamily)